MYVFRENERIAVRRISVGRKRGSNASLKLEQLVDSTLRETEREREREERETGRKDGRSCHRDLSTTENVNVVFDASHYYNVRAEHDRADYYIPFGTKHNGDPKPSSGIGRGIENRFIRTDNNATAVHRRDGNVCGK